MADNDFRSYRSRDQRTDDPSARDSGRDPLAELARLIGQGDSAGEYGARHNQPNAYAEAPAAGAVEWSADDGYAEPAPHPDDRSIQPRLPEPYPDYASYPAQPPQQPEVEYAPPPAARIAPPAPDFVDSRYASQDPHDAVGEDDYQRDDQYSDDQYRDDQYRDEQAPPDAYGQAVPPLAPQSHDDGYEADDRWQAGADDQAYPTDEYDDAAQSPRRRSGLVTVLAVLGLAALGSAGAFGYHTMFGSAMLPGLPPIIKPSDGPNKIVPSRGDSQANASNPAGAAAAGSSEKLVSREEQPVDIPAAPKTSPRVVSTIPVMPTSPGGAAPPSASAAMTAPMPGPQSASPFPPAPAATPAAPSASAMPAAPAGGAEPKKIHTVTIRQDQSAGANAAAPAAHAKLPAPPAGSTRPAAPQGGSNAPLSIVPSAEGGAASPPPAHTQVARASPAAAPIAPAAAAPAMSGGYSVQLSSQRSEAEAQSAYRGLQSRFPSQLANRQPMIRRADLGAKGTYYRTMVGPYASREQAIEMCTSLKAAGGSCIVQRNN